MIAGCPLLLRLVMPVMPDRGEVYAYAPRWRVTR